MEEDDRHNERCGGIVGRAHASGGSFPRDAEVGVGVGSCVGRWRCRWPSAVSHACAVQNCGCGCPRGRLYCHDAKDYPLREQGQPADPSKRLGRRGGRARSCIPSPRHRCCRGCTPPSCSTVAPGTDGAMAGALPQPYPARRARESLGCAPRTNFCAFQGSRAPVLPRASRSSALRSYHLLATSAHNVSVV